MDKNSTVAALAGLREARSALEFVDRLYSTKGGVINPEHYGLIANSNECGQMINAVRDAVRKLAALEAAARLPAPRVPDDLVKEIIADALVGTHGYGGSLERARMDIANRIEKWLAALKYYASHADGGTGVAEAALATPSPQAPVQLSVPAQDERPVIETANLVTPVDVGPGYCEDSPFSINRATLAQSLKGPGPLAVAIMSGATGKPNQPLEEWLAAQDVFLSERHLDAVKSYIVMNLLPVVPAATQEPAGSGATCRCRHGLVSTKCPIHGESMQSQSRDFDRSEGLYLKFSEPPMEPHTPVIIERVNGDCTVSQFIIARDEAHELINQLREFLGGSPRKVGEDGAKIGDEVTWTGQEGKRCRERIRRITEPQPGNYVFWVGKDEFPVNHQQVELVPRPSGLSLSSPIEPTPSANSEVSRYFWDKAARWLDGQKMPPDLQRTMELAKLLEEVAADGATSQSFK